MSEIQTCPTRMGESGPWKREENLDTWETDRWIVDPEVVRAKHDAEDARGLLNCNENNVRFDRPAITLEEYRAEWYVRGPNNDLWLWDWGPPRTCSFCGGIHPEDAMRLLGEGWEHEKAKSYKGYLEPPGSRTRSDAFLASIKDKSREVGQGVPSVWSPTPPVKMYVAHFSDEQLARLNALLSGEVMRYRSIPFTVEATRYLGPTLIPEGHALPEAPDGVQFSPASIAGDRRPYVITANGQAVFVQCGEWVIQEPHGTGAYPCLDSVFQANYESLEKPHG